MSKKRIKELEANIIAARDAYYNADAEVSDAVYDAWVAELKKLAPDSKAITAIGAPPKSSWDKVEHEVPMGSLNKVHAPEELEKWCTICKYAGKLLCIEKLDGLSVDLKYEKGTLVQALTRGDGEVGEDITVNVLRMEGVKKTLPTKITAHIRGEIIVRKFIYIKYLSEKYTKGHRSAAIGIARRPDGQWSDKATVMCYHIEGIDFDTELAMVEAIRKMGLLTPNYKLCSNTDAVIKEWQAYQDSKREALDYIIDGLVIRINDREEQLSLGEKSNRPAGQVAFKFEPDGAETVIKEIDWPVGDTGNLTPLCYFDPVELMDTTVKQASAYNFDYVKRNGITVGATVLVIKAGDVIPRVEEVIKKTGDKPSHPTKCPACGTKLEFRGAFLYCPNTWKCPPQILGRMSKWVSENGIMYWGDSTIQKLIDAGLVSDVSDIYALTQDQIASVERMGEKNAKKLLKELDKFRTIPLENLLGGLNIPNVATSTIKQVMKEGHDTLDKIRALSVSQLAAVPKFGDTRAKALYDGLRTNADRIQAILDSGVKIKAQSTGSLAGQSLAFTGTMSRPRPELAQLAKAAGGEVKKSVGKGLSFLVIDDVNSTSSKAKAAKKFGTKLLSEKQFLDLVGAS